MSAVSVPTYDTFRSFHRLIRHKLQASAVKIYTLHYHKLGSILALLPSLHFLPKETVVVVGVSLFK